MKKLFGVTCALVFTLISTQGNAADFKGFYAGINFGGAHGSSDAATTTVFSPTGYFAQSSVPAIAIAGKQTLSGNGFNGGGLVGFNLQHHHFVAGVETDFGGMNLSQSKSSTATYPCCAPTAFKVTQFTGTSYLFTLRPRVGFTGGPVMVYGTGGLALSNVEYTALFTDTFATAEENGGKTSTQSGWAAGAGAEIKARKHWTVKGEFLHADFGNLTNTSTNLTAFTPRIAFPTNVFTHTANLSANIYRFGFNFYF